MKKPAMLHLSTDAALTLKDIIISSMPVRSAGQVAPMETLLWITLRSVARKIHDKTFDEPKTVSITLSSTEELALYAFLLRDEDETALSLDASLLHFLHEVDRKLKDNLFFIDQPAA